MEPQCGGQNTSDYASNCGKNTLVASSRPLASRVAEGELMRRENVCRRTI